MSSSREADDAAADELLATLNAVDERVETILPQTSAPSVQVINTSTNPAQAIPVKASAPSVDLSDLVVEEILGKGNFGVSILCQYNGNDPEITRLCIAGRIVVKLPLDGGLRAGVRDKMVDDLENNLLSISSYLNQVQPSPAATADFIKEGKFITDVSNKSLRDRNKYNNGLNAFVNNQPLILSQLEACGYDANNVPCAVGNIERYFAKQLANPVSMHVIAQMPIQTIQERKLKSIDLAKRALDVMAVQMAASAYDSLSALHDAGKLHIDGAIRNQMPRMPEFDNNGNAIHFPAVMIDYGMGADYDPTTGRSLESRRESGVAFISLNDDMFSSSSSHYVEHTNLFNAKYYPGVRSDLYGAKLALTEVVASIAGANFDADIMRLNRDGSNKYVADRFLMSDEGMLNVCYQRMILHAEKMSGSAAEDTKLMLYCYQDYLTKMPSNNNFPDYRGDDRALREAGNDKYFQIKLAKTIERFENGAIEQEEFLTNVRMLANVPTSPKMAELKSLALDLSNPDIPSVTIADTIKLKDKLGNVGQIDIDAALAKYSEDLMSNYRAQFFHAVFSDQKLDGKKMGKLLRNDLMIKPVLAAVISGPNNYLQYAALNAVPAHIDVLANVGADILAPNLDGVSAIELSLAVAESKVTKQAAIDVMMFHLEKQLADGVAKESIPTLQRLKTNDKFIAAINSNPDYADILTNIESKLNYLSPNTSTPSAVSQAPQVGAYAKTANDVPKPSSLNEAPTSRRGTRSDAGYDIPQTVESYMLNTQVESAYHEPDPSQAEPPNSGYGVVDISVFKNTFAFVATTTELSSMKFHWKEAMKSDSLANEEFVSPVQGETKMVHVMQAILEKLLEKNEDVYAKILFRTLANNASGKLGENQIYLLQESKHSEKFQAMLSVKQQQEFQALSMKAENVVAASPPLTPKIPKPLPEIPKPPKPLSKIPKPLPEIPKAAAAPKPERHHRRKHHRSPTIGGDYQPPHHARELFGNNKHKSEQSQEAKIKDPVSRQETKKRHNAFTEAVNRFRGKQTQNDKPAVSKPKTRSPLEEAKNRLDADERDDHRPTRPRR